MSARNESQITNPTYMGAVPGNIEGGDFERVPFGFSSQSLSQSSPLLLAPPPREGSEINRGAHDNDLEVSPPSSGSDAETLQPTPLIAGGQGQVRFHLSGGGSKEEKMGDPGETLRTPPRKLRPTLSIVTSPERRFTPYTPPRTPTTPSVPILRNQGNGQKVDGEMADPNRNATEVGTAPLRWMHGARKSNGK